MGTLLKLFVMMAEHRLLYISAHTANAPTNPVNSMKNNRKRTLLQNNANL